MTECWTAGAAQDYRWFREIDRLIDDLKRRPFVGIGKPEPLQGTGRELQIAQCRYHY